MDLHCKVSRVCAEVPSVTEPPLSAGSTRYQVSLYTNDLNQDAHTTGSRWLETPHQW